MDEQDSLHEQGFLAGERAAWVAMLRTCLGALAYQAPEALDRVAWVVEREEALAVLRVLCRDYGDTDWPDTLALADILDKHLAPFLG